MTPTEAGVLATTPVEEVLEKLAVLEQRVDHGYRTVVASRLKSLDRTVEHGFRARAATRLATLERSPFSCWFERVANG